MLPTRPGRRIGALLAAATAVGCAGACSATEAPAPAPPPPPPPPPAACLLDTAALAAATGLSWAPDPTTASDTRCVYDPAGTARPAEGPAFLTVEMAPDQTAPDPATTLDTVAALCEDGSRAPVGDQDGGDQDGAAGSDSADGEGFVCRFQGDSVFAAVVRDGRLVTLAASAVPPGTTAARLVVAFDRQVAALSR